MAQRPADSRGMSILVGKVRSVDDFPEPGERLIAGALLLDQGLERAAAAVVPVRVGCPRGVEPDGSLPVLERRDLFRLDEKDLRLRVEEAPDEPAGRGAIHVDAFSGHPFHALLPGPRPPRRFYINC